MLEDLDFAAGEDSDIDPLEGDEKTEEDVELAELMKAKKELMARMQIASGSGMEVMPDGEDEDEDEEAYYDEEEDMENLWHQAGLEDGELDDLLADADADEEEQEAPAKKSSKKDKKKKKASSEKSKKPKSKVLDEEDLDQDAEETSKPAHSFTPLEEPTFVSSKKTKSRDKAARNDDILGDPTALNEADATDKERRKRSLQFHTSKIASTSARRAAARASRLGGDEDLPYRDRQAARDAALRKNSMADAREGEDLDGSEWTEKDKKRAREVREEDGDDAGEDDGEDYYDLVKRRKTAKAEAKAAAHEDYQAAKL